MKKILDSTWKHPAGKVQIGIAAVETDAHLMPGQRTWQAYIAAVDTGDKETDLVFIANFGAKLTAQEAHGFFPKLDIKNYKQ